MPPKPRRQTAFLLPSLVKTSRVNTAFVERPNTLIKLSVRGSDFPSLQHLNLEQRAATFVCEIIGSADAERWLSLRSLLRPLAEAAPKEVLRAIEFSLDKPNQPVGALLRETDSAGIFGGGCYYADLLWALEILAWAPERLARVAIILARLSNVEIKGNWGNKPENSLLSLFKSWMPQTSATIERRMAALDKLIEQEESIGFEMLDRLVNFGHDVGTYNARPLWRDDDAGSGHGATNLERHQMVVEAAERMFRLAVGKPKRISALVRKIANFLAGLLRALSEQDAVSLLQEVSSRGSLAGWSTDITHRPDNEARLRSSLAKHAGGVSILLGNIEFRVPIN